MNLTLDQTRRGGGLGYYGAGPRFMSRAEKSNIYNEIQGQV